jgi:hypothetical protein
MIETILADTLREYCLYHKGLFDPGGIGLPPSLPYKNANSRWVILNPLAEPLSEGKLTLFS